MASITTRATTGSGATVKGSPLSNTEVDENFINLNLDKVDKTGDSMSGHFVPSADATYDLGADGQGWRNIYTNDLHLSNMKHETGNAVDGTKGDWTIQEGEEDLFLINNRSGKKYKFTLTEV